MDCSLRGSSVHGIFFFFFFLSMGFSRREYWRGLPFPSPRDLPDPGIKPGSPALYAEALPSKPPGKSPPTHRKVLSLVSLVFFNQQESFDVLTTRSLLHISYILWLLSCLFEAVTQSYLSSGLNSPVLSTDLNIILNF